jgi:hypothetical protein
LGDPRNPLEYNPQNPLGYNPYQSPLQQQRPPHQPGLGDNLGMRMLLPVGRSAWAIAAGYAGLFSLLCFPAPLALLLGIIAIIDIQRNPHKHGMGRAIFGIVMGLIFSLILAFGMLNAMAGGMR